MKLTRIIAFSISALAIQSAVAQKQPKKPAKQEKVNAQAAAVSAVSKPVVAEDPTLINLGAYKVPLSEFNYVYKKSNDKSEDAYTEASLKEYLELYTNFKLKVINAMEAGMDTSKQFNEELETYRKQLAQPYLTEKSVSEKLIKEAYERMKTEVNASHILILAAPDADPKDSLLAYTKIMDIRKRIMAGESFDKLAEQYSEDPSAKQNKGNLGYFSAMQMVYPFEQAAYNNAIGAVSKPVRTRFGYHIVKTLAKRPAQGQVKVSHIMIKLAEGASKDDSTTALNKINEIYKKLSTNKSEDFASLCQQFSDDASSKEKGGELPMFGTGQMLPSFEDASFALKNIGDISKPFLSPYGWHVVKLMERKELESFEKLESDIKQRVARDSRSELNRETLLARLRKENNLVEYPAIQKQVYAKADTSLVSGRWSFKADDKLIDQTFIKIKDMSFTVGQFYDFVKSTQQKRNSNSPEFLMKLAYKAWVDKMMYDYEETHLADKYLDYKMLMKEYREGIMLFSMMDKKVWSKAIEDTAGLRNYFNKNSAKYRWNQRVNATIYNAKDDATLKRVQEDTKLGYFAMSEPKFERIGFEKNSNKMTERGRDAMRRLSDFIKRDKSLRIELQSFADVSEKKSVSKKRLKAVVDSLTKRGVDIARVMQKDVSNTAPKSSTDDNMAVHIAVFGSTPKQMERAYNVGDALTLKVTDGLFQKGENQILDEVEWKAGDKLLTKNDRKMLVRVRGVEAPRNKTLEESRGLATTDYQNTLEKEWLTELKKKYPVTVNEAEFKKLIKK